MLAKSLTCAVVGLEGALVEVEVDLGPGLPAFTIFGLPDVAVQEAKARVRAAVKNPGADSPSEGSLSTWHRPLGGKRGRSCQQGYSAHVERRFRADVESHHCL
jgi:Subunit ChlI of Mg-chelatase